MNPNLMNPTIVTRLAEEREIEMRRMPRGLPEAEIVFDKPAAPKTRRHKRLFVTFFAWMYSIIGR